MDREEEHDQRAARDSAAVSWSGDRHPSGGYGFDSFDPAGAVTVGRVDLYEHQGKELLARYAIPVPVGALAATPEQAGAQTASLGRPVVIKAQVLSGGRGKAGGVVRVEDPQAAVRPRRGFSAASSVGTAVELLLVEPACEIAHEYYLAVSVDRGAAASCC